MIVCIAEKPSVAKEIADVLGARTRREGYLEGNGYQVTWTFGHLCTLKEPHDYTSQWKSWSLSSLPMIPPRFGIKLIDDRGIEKQFGIIKSLMQQADMIINCGDAGQEGELIQRWVMQKAEAKCPVKRLWVSSLTDESIREGFAKLMDASDKQSLYEAGLCRAIGDWVLGMNATRLYTLKYGQNRQVLSIGRVQTPTLALIVKRQQEIDNFVPQQFWVLKTIYRGIVFNAIVKRSDEDLMADIEKLREKAEKKGVPFDMDEAWRKADAENIGMEPIASEEQGMAILSRIKEAPFTITSVTKKDGKELPPSLFDLSSLQTECDKRFSIPVDVTLQTVQSLYEKKVTTYPRVDTTYLSDDVYAKCPQILMGLRDYQHLITPLHGRPLQKSKKVFDNKKVTDHHAIIPTGVYPQALTDIEKKIYDLIVRRFIAVFHPDCKTRTTTVLGESDGIPFRTSGKEIVEPGWRVVFEKNTVSDSSENSENSDSSENPDNCQLSIVNCQFTKGESGPHQPELVERWTQPPKPYTEGTLVRAMETAGKFVDDEELRDAMKENGIGRPATRAEIIKTLYKRNYITKVRKNLMPTPTGIELISLIREELLKSAELTGIWEKRLRDIEARKYDAKQFIAELKQMVADIVHQVLSDNTPRRIQ
ncbi:MAG: DNA topoisomerase 3 [Bacteroidaceae bacterium]|nr:DNA topoisomerase 3 [Bacteroidaceae bacterium]